MYVLTRCGKRIDFAVDIATNDFSSYQKLSIVLLPRILLTLYLINNVVYFRRYCTNT